MSKKRTHEEYVTLLKELRPDIQVIEEYKTNLIPIKHLCKCGREWIVRPADLLRKDTVIYCTECGIQSRANKRRKGYEYEQWVLKNRPNLKIIGTYVNADTPILHRCECGEEWECRPYSIKAGCKCFKCSGKGDISTKSKNTKKITKEEYENWLLNNTDIELISAYTNQHDKTEHRYKSCGHIDSFRPVDLKNGHNRLCNICEASKDVEKFHMWLSSIYQGTIVVNDRNTIKPKEIDFYLPDIKIGIEFNDLYTHYSPFIEQEIKPNWNKGKPTHYHYNKWKMAKEKGIRLIQVWDIEWNNEKIQPILKSVILHALGKSKNKIFARNCELIKINSKMGNDFFNKTHIQGAAKGIGYFGLFYDNKIIGAICYCKSISKSDVEYTVSRMSFELNTVVVGGASRLLKAVKREINNKPIEYLVLNDYYSGLSFQKTKWENKGSQTMTRYYNNDTELSEYRHSSRYAENKADCISGKKVRYFTSGTTIYKQN